MQKEKYLRSFFGNSAEYYLKQYDAFHSGTRFTFNFGPFLFGGLWFLYRKLWSEAVIILLLHVLSGMLQTWYFKANNIASDTQLIILTSFSLMAGIVYGFIGNYLYIMKADRSIPEIVNLTNDEGDRVTFLTALGGVSWLPFALGAVAVFLLLIGKSPV